MSKPRMVVFFSGQGGACKGYENAGWDVVRAVDLLPQPRYYRPEVFQRGDALEVFWDLMRAWRPHAVHASCPCQRWTLAQRIQAREHPDLITPFRGMLLEYAASAGALYVMENVEGSPLKEPIMLCGTMFSGLRTRRHRLFESNVSLVAPEHPAHTIANQPVKMGRPVSPGDWYHAVGNFHGMPYIKRNMGVPWMNRDGVRECIPPVYSQYVGAQLIQHLG